MVFGRFGMFVIGGGVGAYVAQNYAIPNVANQVEWAIDRARELERDLKKSSAAQQQAQAAQASQKTLVASMSPTKMRQ